MSLTLHLLGRPRIRSGSDSDHTVRSRKSWAVLAFLLLGDRAPTRAELAALLFDEADDPLRALRWSLSELRRALAGHAVLEGDPVVLELAGDVVVDVAVVSRGSWADAMELPDVGAELLAGVEVAGAAGFESWLLAERRRVAAASEAILHEAALGAMSQGNLDRALGYATRVAAMSPLDENHHALLIRLYRMTGEEAAAQRQLAICTELLEREFGTTPGPAVAAALRERRVDHGETTTRTSIEALAEAGAAAVAAGATETGADSLRAAVRMSDRGDHTRLRVSTRLALADTLVHSLRGLDEEGMATLLAADDIASGPRRRRRDGGGPCRAGLRGLPPGAVRAGRGVALAGPRPRCRRSRGRGEGHDVPGVGRERPRRLRQCPAPPRRGQAAGRAGRRRPAGRLRRCHARPRPPAPG